MFDEQEIKQLKEVFVTKEDLKTLVTKEDLKLLATKEDLEEEIEGLAAMINTSFNKTEERMAEGFKAVREDFKVVNEKLDKKVDVVDKRMTRIEEALVIK